MNFHKALEFQSREMRSELSSINLPISARLGSNHSIICSARLGSAQKLTIIKLKKVFGTSFERKSMTQLLSFQWLHAVYKQFTYVVKSFGISPECPHAPCMKPCMKPDLNFYFGLAWLGLIAGYFFCLNLF